MTIRARKVVIVSTTQAGLDGAVQRAGDYTTPGTCGQCGGTVLAWPVIPSGNLAEVVCGCGQVIQPPPFGFKCCTKPLCVCKGRGWKSTITVDVKERMTITNTEAALAVDEIEILGGEPELVAEFEAHCKAVGIPTRRDDGE